MTLYILDNKQSMKRSLMGYGAATIFCFVFQIIYEKFAHGVTSYFMVLAFLIPLIGGLISVASIYVSKGGKGNIFRQLICGGVIWLTLGSIFQGVLEIYGTTNRLIIVFVVVGMTQLILAVLAGITEK